MPDAQGRPVMYLDTNVLLDAMFGRRRAAQSLLERIRENRWPAITSPFSILEMLEAKKADKWAEKLLVEGWSFFQIQRKLGERRTGPSQLRRKELEEVYLNLQARLKPVLEIVTLPEPTPGLFDRAEDVSASTNIEATDVFHLATALEFGCDMLVTADRDFAKLAKEYIITTVPEGFEKALQEFYRSGQ